LSIKLKMEGRRSKVPKEMSGFLRAATLGQ